MRGNSFLFVSVSLLLTLAATGCRPHEDVAFRYRDAVGDLPEKQQEQVKRFLTAYFGTASAPRLAIADPEGELDEQGRLPKLDQMELTYLRHGQQVFVEYCAACHGITGDGAGVAAGVSLESGEWVDYLNPRPRDYRMGKFKFTSTPRGYKPRRSDLKRIIRYGAKGTSMPAFRWLPDEDLEPLIDYVILLSQRGELEDLLLQEAEFELEEEDDYDPEIVAEYVDDIKAAWDESGDQIVLPVTRRPVYSDESILAGRAAFLSRGCAKCHGNDGRGNPEENVGKDDWGQVAYAADLSSGMLHGGRRPIDIYRRIYAGINGTPMPGFGDALAEEPETAWHLVHYIMSIVEARDVEGLDEIQPPPPPEVEVVEEAVTVPENEGAANPDSPTEPNEEEAAESSEVGASS